MNTLKIKKFIKVIYKKSIEKVLPEKKKIEVISAKKSNVVSGASDYIYGKKNEIIGQTIEMPMKSGKMAQTNIAVFMHELTHVMDALVNQNLQHEQIECINIIYIQKNMII